MIIERSMQADWLSNAYLVGDEDNGKAVVIDSGGPSGPLLEAAERHGLDVELLLLTHHHGDHVFTHHEGAGGNGRGRLLVFGALGGIGRMGKAAGDFAAAQTALAAKFRLVRYAINEAR